jgi:hypothetical protein
MWPAPTKATRSGLLGPSRARGWFAVFTSRPGVQDAGRALRRPAGKGVVAVERQSWARRVGFRDCCAGWAGWSLALPLGRGQGPPSGRGGVPAIVIASALSCVRPIRSPAGVRPGRQRSPPPLVG